ncbi:MAG: NADH-quinone oxidoreductase subunit NuoN [Pseudomonadota bacterium]
MTLSQSLIHAAPEISMAVGAMALLMFGVFRGEGSGPAVSRASVALLIFAAFLVAVGAPTERLLLFGGGFVVDAFSTFCKVVILLGAATAVLMSERFLTLEKLLKFEYPILIVIATLGMMLMVSSNDLISLYMGVELQSLSLYVLAAFNRDSARATEAGLKYFVLGALSSGLLLYGASLIYGFTGATTFDGIAAVAASEGASPGLVFGIVFLISGLAFKVSAAPFHMWTPDVYEGAPTPVTALFAAAPKLAGMALFVRAMVGPFSEVTEEWRQVLVLISLASMVIGAFSAIAQTNIKRLMAYSSISHMGYALVGLAAGTELGVRAVLIYMTIYVITTIGAFACILSMRRVEGMSEQIADLSGLSRTRPMMATMLTVLLISLAGVPPAAGFFGKFYVFTAALDAGLLWLAIVGVLTSVVGAYYYLRIIKIMWFDEPAPAFDKNVGFTVGAAAGVAAILNFPVLVVAIAPLKTAAGAAAAALF